MSVFSNAMLGTCDIFCATKPPVRTNKSGAKEKRRERKQKLPRWQCGANLPIRRGHPNTDQWMNRTVLGCLKETQLTVSKYFVKT